MRETFRMSVLLEYPLNPDFGDGVFYRRIQLTNQGNACVGQLEDCCHGFEVTIHHDGESITDVEPTARRVPFNTCPGAGKLLGASLIGQSIHSNLRDIYTWCKPRSQCTHWLDLALLAVKQAARRNEHQRDYVVSIPDETDKPVQAAVYCNQEQILAWHVHNWSIHQPEALQGNTLHKGFSQWMFEYFDGDVDKQEAAFVLQKGYFVSCAKRYDINCLAGKRAVDDAHMAGSCYTYGEANIDSAVRQANSFRDFTDNTAALLRFE